MPFEYRRLPAVPKNIADIREGDVRVRILGRVLDRTDGVLVLDDGTGKAEIVADTDVRHNELVRVFARVLPLENGYELRAELVQPMHALDIELHQKVRATHVAR
ncbi:MAG: hypothetical protein HYY37_00660 [Candidatus Aenigmarchaeota archaeon]|nr:hypothetical protein [Candidatus Aenigmarchaeota archaeon]